MTDALWVLACLGLAVWLYRRLGRRRPEVTQSEVVARQNFVSMSDAPPAGRRAAPKNAATAAVRWVSINEPCSVQRFTVPGGLIYVGTPPRAYGFGNDRKFVHVIDPGAEIDARNADMTGQSVPYWSSYDTLSPQARAGYLSWLVGGRRDHGAGIGFLFLFLYGLEHRLFTEGAWTDAPAILHEVEALLRTYEEHAAFRSHASRFIDAVRVSLDEIPDEPPSEPGPRGYELPLTLQVGLSRQLQNGRLPGNWLFAWFVAHPETQLRTPATRCFDEFRQLFLVRFAEQYPQGLATRVPTKKLKLAYQPSSGTPRVVLREADSNLPDPSALTAPLKVAATLAAQCMSDLDSYSRFIGRHPAKRQTLAASTLLPAELRGDATPMFETYRAKLGAMAPNGIAETTVGALLTELGFAATPGKKPSATDVTQLSIGLQALGFGMEPDPRFGGKIGEANTFVLLFRARDGASIDPTRAAYVAARMLIEIAAVAATIDAENVVPGLKLVEAEIGKLPELTDDERLRLYAFLVSFRRTTPNPRSVLSKLTALAEDQRERIARVTLGALLADRYIGPDEVAFAEKLYKALSLPAQQLYSDIHAATGDAEPPARELPRVATASPGPKGTPIPPRPPASRPRTVATPPSATPPLAFDPTKLAERRRAADAVRGQLVRSDPFDDVTQPSPAPTVVAAPQVTPPAPPSSPIDAAALARKRQETDAVRKLLSVVFSDEDEAPPLAIASGAMPVQVASASQRCPGLDDDHAALIELIIAKRGSIARNELEAEVVRRGMFFDGALEAINDWAFDRFDALLIEEGDPCHIPEHLLLKLLEAPEAA